MKLRQRILAAVAITTVVLTGGIYILFSSILISSYLDLERRESMRNVDRIRDAMDGQAQDLFRGTIDWSYWDDCYKFIQDSNPGFVEANLQTMTLKLDEMIFLDSNGKIVYSRPVQRTPGVKAPDARAVRKLLDFDKPKGISNHDREIGGLMQIGDRVMIMSARKILNSDRNKEPKGWLVWLLYMDQAEQKSHSDRSHIDFELFPISSKNLPRDIEESKSKLSGSNSAFSKSINEDEVFGYGTILDFRGVPCAIVRVKEPRLIYHQGRESIQQMTAFLFLTALLFSIVFIFLVDAFALRRIASLSMQVERATDQRTSTKRISLSGNDELTWLASKTQDMVAKLQERREQLRQNHDYLQETVSKLASAKSVLEYAVEGIGFIDKNGYFSVSNGSLAAMLGYGREELSDVSWKGVIEPAYHKRFQEALMNSQKQHKVSLELTALRKSGAEFHADVVIVRPEGEDDVEQGYHLFIKDISERKCLETRIQHQAFHDSLTGLPNRALFMQTLGEAVGRAKESGNALSVLFLDLDNFKIINDSLGHESGDQLLIKIAGRLRDCLRAEDMISRLGGDEFTVILEDLESLDRAREIAARIVGALSMPIQLDHGDTVAHASIGIAYVQGSDATAESLLRDADTAMYAAKSRGKSGFVVFDPSMNQQVVERMDLETGMREALERNEFKLEYQPIVDLTSGSITGVEALLRWDHPEKGRICPDKFIAVAEDCGLIMPIGSWVLRQACLDFERMKAIGGEHLAMSVNLSGRQLQRDESISQIKTILEETGIDPQSLRLEVTESVLIRDETDSVAKLHEIKALGVKIAIDDFGTGYSSLSTLHSYPVDVVKIDREFIQRMGQEEEIDAIVGAIVLLSRVMHLEVTAEGLETLEQVQYLQAFGCNSAQGFYFSPPIPFEGIAKLLADGGKLATVSEKVDILTAA
ncbi:MAG TPA: EAL domain-containing protein [Fimbriimonadaceae bacterium]|nr:EAL domain-containing protein [Fimbriimonadaceae bacterium]